MPRRRRAKEAALRTRHARANGEHTNTLAENLSPVSEMQIGELTWTTMCFGTFLADRRITCVEGAGKPGVVSSLEQAYSLIHCSIGAHEERQGFSDIVQEPGLASQVPTSVVR